MTTRAMSNIVLCVKFRPNKYINMGVIRNEMLNGEIKGYG